MFTILLIAFPIYLISYNILNLVNGFLFNNMVVIMVTIIILFIILALLGMISFNKKLLSSYKFEKNQIVKGRLLLSHLDFKKFKVEYLNENYLKTSNLLHGVFIKFSLKHLSLFSTLHSGSILKIIAGVLLNINQDFVGKYFDTDAYKKEYYNNPKLLKKEGATSNVAVVSDNVIGARYIDNDKILKQLT